MPHPNKIQPPICAEDLYPRFHPINLFRWNRKIARRIEESVLRGYSIEEIYRNTVRESLEPGSLVLDLGAGARCVYATRNLRVIGADILFSDLANNQDIQASVVSNLNADFPFRPESVDAVTACYFVEHVPDTENLIRNVARVLRPGGRLFMLFPGRYAPFAVVNRVIPNRLTNWCLRRFLEESHGGFRAVYHNCGLKPMKKVLARNGLRLIEKEVCFYQSHYYSSFLPIYLLSLAYDLMIKSANLTSLAASACIMAEKL
jgi:SAM-dependent methyltransferase